ncbi:MAG: peptide ABC transporter substrate-binding protein [Chloroflexi bacterium]|nr:peptide ABC transporter substrate-binding protein [Chloroflexota bacterium]
MTWRDKLVVVALVILLMAASAAAVLTESGPGLPSAPAYGGTYVEGVAGVPQYLNPLIAATNVDDDVASLVFSGLTRYDKNGTIVTDLASGFRTEAEGKIWNFELRSDARWHDGIEVTSADVLYTIKLLQDAAHIGPFADAFRGVRVEAIGRKSVRFTLPDAYGPFLNSTTAPLLPAHLLSAVPYAELARQQFNARPVGTGPFRVSEVDGRQITLVRSDDFYRVRPERSRAYLDKIVFRFFRDPSEALLALSRGEIDGVGGLTSAEADRARGLKNIRFYSLPTGDFTALFLNVSPEKPTFRDRAVRQAVATAIDRVRVLQVATEGRGRLADGIVPPTSWAYVKDIKRYAYDIADAKRILDEADWKDHDGDGVRDKGGVALSFSLSTSDEPGHFQAGVQVAEDLRAIGMKVELRSMPFAELVDRIARQRSFDAMLVSVARSGDPDPYEFFHSSQSRDPGHNFSGYSTLPLDRSLESARRISDQAKRLELYVTVFQQIAIEAPVVFLYFSDYLYAIRRDVQGVVASSIDDRTQRLWNAEDWYVKTVRR